MNRIRKASLLDPVYEIEHFDSKVRVQRKSLFKILGKKCVECGTVEDLTFHHKNQCTDDNRLDNLEVLCRACHDMKDFGKITKNAKLKEPEKK